MPAFRKRLATTVAVLGLAFAQSALAADPSPALAAKIEQLKQEWAANPVLIQAIEAQNALNTPLAAIKELDERWRATPGLASFMEPIMGNAAAEELYRLEAAAGYVLESFVMDNQGALVASTNKTSDYWQGDEAKFTESFRNGAGGVHVGDVEFDSSAQTHLAQVSLAIMKDGKAIGAITIGVDVQAID